MQTITIPKGHIATVVTHLEMHERPKPKPIPPSALHLARWHEAEPEHYRALFKDIGAHWLWFSRLILDDTALLDIIRCDKVEIYAAMDTQGNEVGMLELDFRTSRKTEIKFFGLSPEMSGKGHGRWLMEQTLALAWRKNTDVVWLHTCTLDHPAALPFYIKHGFKPVGQEIETFPDPRLIGILPQNCAPQIPLLGGCTGEEPPCAPNQHDHGLDLG